MLPYVSIRQHTSASVSIRQHKRYLKPGHEEESEGQAMRDDDECSVCLYVIPSQRADQESTSQIIKAEVIKAVNRGHTRVDVSIREHT